MTLGNYLSKLSKPEIEELLQQIRLTEEERKIFDLVLQGYTQKSIVYRCAISESTMKRRIKSIKEKVGDTALKKSSNRPEVPISEKYLLSPLEASAYFNIGEDKLKEMTDYPNCEMIVWNGSHRLFKRQAMEKFLEKKFAI